MVYCSLSVTILLPFLFSVCQSRFFTTLLLSILVSIVFLLSFLYSLTCILHYCPAFCRQHGSFYVVFSYIRMQRFISVYDITIFVKYVPPPTNLYHKHKYTSSSVSDNTLKSIFAPIARKQNSVTSTVPFQSRVKLP